MWFVKRKILIAVPEDQWKPAMSLPSISRTTATLNFGHFIRRDSDPYSKLINLRWARMAEKPNFEIWLVYSERHISVPSDKCPLDALIEAGVPVAPGCRTGSCGECITQYVEGDIHHQDACLTPAERERMFCPCVSRARGRLVLPF